MNFYAIVCSLMMTTFIACSPVHHTQRHFIEDVSYAFAPNVSEIQRKLVRKGINVWVEALPGVIGVHEVPMYRFFELRWHHCARTVLINVVTSKHSLVVEREKDRTVKVMGFVQRYENILGLCPQQLTESWIWLVKDRMKNNNDVSIIAAHEFGHALGLLHTEGDDSIMNGQQWHDTKLCLNSYDAEELCRVFICEPENVYTCR